MDVALLKFFSKYVFLVGFQDSSKRGLFETVPCIIIITFLRYTIIIRLLGIVCSNLIILYTYNGSSGWTLCYQ
jgi:hypothetical protein